MRAGRYGPGRRQVIAGRRSGRLPRMLRALWLGVVLAAVGVAAVSCSDANDDPVGVACKVVVDRCKVGTNLGDCIDWMAELPPECIDCIAASTSCTYTSCERSASGCRIPPSVMK
jgi:hypothetical protein